MTKHGLWRLLTLAGALLLAVGIVNATDEQRAVISVENVASITELEIVYQTSEVGLRSITDVAFVPNRPLVAFVDGTSLVDNGIVYFYDTLTSDFVSIFDDPLEAVRIQFDATGTYLVMGNRSGEIQIYDLASGELLYRFAANDEVIEAIAIDENAEYIATATTNAVAGVGTYTFGLFSLGGDAYYRELSNNASGLATTFLNDSEIVAFVTVDFVANSLSGTVRLFDISTGTQVATCDEHNFTSRDILSTSDGSALFYAAFDGVRLWNLASCESADNAWSLFAEIPADEQIWAMDLHPTEPILAVGTGRILAPGNLGIIHLFDSVTGEELKVLEVATETTTYSTIYSLDFSSDGTLLISGSDDGTVRLWGIPND